MSRIRGRGNKDTELALAKLLKRHGIKGWRRHVEIRGRDAALRRHRPVQGRNKPGTVATLHASRTSQRDVPTSKRGAHGLSRHSQATAEVTRPTFRVKPDFVFLKSRTAIFVDGCFWHGCPRHATKPRNNYAFWKKKLAGNKTRDRLVNRTLRRGGWRVIRIWECDLARLKAPAFIRFRRGKKGQRLKAGPNKVVRRIQQALV